MSTLTIRRISKFIEKTFEDKIDTSNINSKASDSDKKKQVMSRGLAAYSLTVQALAEVDDAVASITDGYNDNGIDAIYFDESTKTLWLVQSKFIESGQGGIDNGDIEKFAKGVKKLINADFSSFNDRVKSRQNEILDALDDSSVTIQILIAYTGKKLSAHNVESLQDLLNEQNDTEELIVLNDFNIDKAYEGLKAGISSAPINEDFFISNWGFIDEPYKSYYGKINGEDLATLWTKYGKRLFARNIRNFLGTSTVNEEISKTIREEPENFIYFNNGITILCESIKKKPIGGNDKSIGAFSCQGVSVVNGAQTFGTIGSFAGQEDVSLENVKVIVKFISLEESPEGFGESITIATNTQNKVDRKDFVSLDPEQARISTELKLESINYHYKRTNEKVTPDENNYLFEEVAFSLAAFQQNVDYSTTVKKQSGKLWEDVQKSPYIDLFNNSVSALKIIKAVKIYRLISNKMQSLASNSQGRTRSIYRYGNSFVSHIVFQNMEQKYWSDTYHGFDDFFKNELPSTVDDTIEKLRQKVEEHYPESMIVYVLRNFTKCRHLKGEMN